VRLHEQGLIYRGEFYLVNWCPASGSALGSDSRVEMKGARRPRSGTSRYPLQHGPAVMASITWWWPPLRPETLLGDNQAWPCHPH